MSVFQEIFVVINDNYNYLLQYFAETLQAKSLLKDFAEVLIKSKQSKDLFVLREEYKKFIYLFISFNGKPLKEQLTNSLNEITDFECFYSMTEEIIDDYIEESEKAWYGTWVSEAKAFGYQLVALYDDKNLEMLRVAIQNFCDNEIKASKRLKEKLLLVVEKINKHINEKQLVVPIVDEKQETDEFSLQGVSLDPLISMIEQDIYLDLYSEADLERLQNEISNLERQCGALKIYDENLMTNECYTPLRFAGKITASLENPCSTNSDARSYSQPEISRDFKLS